MYRTLNPSTGELVEQFAIATDSEVESALDKASTAFTVWRSSSFLQRAALVERVAAILEGRIDRYAELFALEMGKPLQQAKDEIQGCIQDCRSFAQEAERLLSPQVLMVDEGDARVRYDPLGLVLGIMPWNFPFRQVVRFAIPAIMAGNVVILKHAPNVPKCAKAIAEVFVDAGAEAGVFQTLFLSNEQAEKMLGDTRLRGLAFTGSVKAGKHLGAIASSHVKPTVLELGGNDPFIVFSDCDLDSTVSAAVAFRCRNNGQACTAPKRIFVEKQIYQPFVEKFVAGMSARVVGDPLDSATENGPMAREDLRSTLLEQIERIKGEGAELLCGGVALDRPGFFISPAVITGAKIGGVSFTEELFGPVGVVFPFESEDELVRLANSTDYGLGATVWTRSRERAANIAQKLESGMVYINSALKPDARVPFGGVKCSGVGKELGREGIRAFMNTKLVWSHF